jgi:2-alkenal reductase
MSNRFTRYAILWALIIATIWIGDRFVRDVFLLDDEPRAVTPRGELADVEKSTIDLFREASPAVVYITTLTQKRDVYGRTGVAQGAGSGFIWDRTGHIVTNYHVIEGAQRVGVRLDSGDVVEAKVVGGAPDFDLAVLRLDDSRTTLHPIPIGSSADLAVGQAVFAIGNPFGLDRTLTTGVISALGRRLPTDTGREIVGVVQTDAAINPGNSGGPLLDSAGRLIGVNTAILSRSGSAAGIGFAVPVDTVNRIVPRLIAEGRVPRPGIGVMVAPEEVAARLGISGVVIMDVVPGSPAAKAGLVGADRQSGELGDVVTHVNGERVRTLAEMAEQLERIGVGDSATLTVQRDGRARDISVAIIDIS